MREMKLFQAMLIKDKHEFEVPNETRQNMWNSILKILKIKKEEARRMEDEL